MGAAAAGFGAGACASAPEVPENEPVGTVEFLNHDPEVSYVGSEACRSCHEEIAASYRHTGMGRSWSRTETSAAVEDFGPAAVVADPRSDIRYRMLERDGRYFQRQFVTDASGRELAVDEREMHEVIGSNNHSRLYGTWVGDRLYQMPVAWYTRERTWDLAPGYQHNNMLFTREITEECAFCHNGRMTTKPGSRNAYARPLPSGIDCERCHGPGSRHVERWISGASQPSGDIDRTIVNPRRLPVGLRLQVCYQCHLGGSETAERVERDERELADFRPGQSLLDVMVPFGFAEAHPDQFNVTGQVDRMILSRCFTESDGRLECLTCHNPHVSVYRPDRPADHFRSKCLSCHAADDCDESPARRASTSPADDCVACHMRRAEPTDHPRTVFIDHWIRRDPRETKAPSRTEFAMVPILPETAAAVGPGEIEYYRGRSSLLKAYQTVDRAQQAALRKEAEAALHRAIELGVDTADAWYYRGKNLSAMGDWEAAARVLRQAVGRNPRHRDASFEYASALLRLGRHGGAAAVFRSMLERDPEDEAALADLAVCEMTMGRPAEALPLLDRALERDPLRASLHANRGKCLADLGRWTEATEAFERATSLDPTSIPIWEARAALLQETGDGTGASAVRQHAARLRVLQAVAPGRQPETQQVEPVAALIAGEGGPVAPPREINP